MGLSTELLRALAAEAGAAVAAAPQPDDDRVARLAAYQARSGDVLGGRKTARTFSRSWVPFARIAIAQRDSGDIPGALATANLALTSQDRAQAVGYLASALAYAGRLDQALEIARSITWPKQRVEELKLVASQVHRVDSLRARALLREAVQVAQADTSHWGTYLDLALAYEQAATGDVAGALRVLSTRCHPRRGQSASPA